MVSTVRKTTLPTPFIYNDTTHQKNIVSDKRWFLFILLYLVIDYGRPQDVLPIGFLRPAMIVILILTYYIFSSHKIRLSNCKQINLMWCFIFLTALYIPFAENNFWAFDTTRNMLLFMPFIVSIAIVVNTLDRLRKLISVNIIIMVYVCLYSLFHQGMGSGNYFQDENDLSLYVNTILPFCYFLLFCEKNKLQKIGYIIAISLGLASSVVSVSRGGFIGLVSMAFVTWLFSTKKLLSLILIFFLASSIYFFSPESYKKEMSTITNTREGTARDRILSWEAAWHMFLDYPLGVGGNNFMIKFPKYQSFEFHKGMWGRAAHSLWFTLMSEMGIFGILIYLFLLYYNIKNIFFLKKLKINNSSDLRYINFLSRAFIVSFSGFFASATFLSVLYYPHYWYITGMIVATLNITKNILTLDGHFKKQYA